MRLPVPTHWASLLAALALALAAGPAVAQPASDCCTAHGGLGCDDPTCEATVCGADPFCCDVSWDSICAGEAVDLCGALCAAPVCDASAQPGDLIEPEACGDDENGGCNSNPPAYTESGPRDVWAGTAWSNGTRDTDWYRVSVVPSGCTLAGTLISEFDGVVFIVDGITDAAATCSGVVIGTQGNSVSCTPSEASAAVTPGDYAVFVATQFNADVACGGGTEQYRVQVDLSCPMDSDCCNANGTPGCDNAGCQAVVCAADAFCCDVSWDSICESEAEALCAPLCDLPPTPPSGDGDCCSANGTPGCEVAACQDVVCAVDPFCCDVAWDGICASEAADLCGICQPPPPVGACCFVDATCAEGTQQECEAAGGAYQGDDTSCEAIVDAVSEPGLAIPDDSTTGVLDTIEVTESFAITDVDVDLAITHTWVGDLNVTLRHPDGTVITLLNRPGAPALGVFGCREDDVDAILDDEGGGGSVQDQCRATPPAINSPPSYTPLQALSAFDGKDSQGTWTIFVRDVEGGDVGTFDRWSLHITGGTGVECPFVTSLDAKPGSCPNPINRKSNGRIPMALVGQTYLDAYQIDLSTLLLQRADGMGGQVAPNEGPPGPHSKVADAATPFEGELCDCHEEAGDGIDDVLMHFNTQEVVTALDLWTDFSEGDVVELQLTAQTFDGTPVVAGDCQVIVPPGPGVVNVFSSAPEAVIEVSPADSNAITSGSGAFVCEYPPDPTDVVLTARPAVGYLFNGWTVDGGPVIWEETITVHVETDEERTAEALYSAIEVGTSCGLGAELVLLVGPLLWLRRRRV